MALTDTREAFDRQGYVVLRGAFAPDRIEALRLAVEDLVAQGRDGRLQLEWIDREQGVLARLSHLLDPARYREAFGQWLDEDLAAPIEALLDGPARHSLFGMLSGGASQAYRQRWHRDLARPGADDEAAFLRRTHGLSVQFNAPLLADDHFLHIVPQSHVRASLPEEIRASSLEDGEGMPQAMEVRLQPGDIVYYNANLWHRGWNPDGLPRRTLHCAFWRAGQVVMQHEHGQRQGFEVPGHIQRLPGAAAAFVRRYLAAYPPGEPTSLLDI